MKRNHSLFIAVGMIFSTAITSCNKDVTTIEPDPGTMEMTTNLSGDVTFSLNGTGSATVDWGDGSAKETETFTVDEPIEFNHTYSTSKTRTIRIYGNDIWGLNCSNIPLIGLDVSRNARLWSLFCYENQLTSLDVSKNSRLMNLGCGQNQLKSLDLSNNIILGHLYCYDNPLKSLDVSKNIGLYSLGCWKNQLTSLDVSKNTHIVHLVCMENQLTSLDVSKNISLSYLDCWDNRLTSLDMSNNTTLVYLNCYSNQFTTDALDALFGSLHNNSNVIGGIEKYISIHDNPGTATCHPNIATEKEWRVIK